MKTFYYGFLDTAWFCYQALVNMLHIYCIRFSFIVVVVFPSSFFSSFFPTFVKGLGNIFSVCDLVSTNFVRALTVGYHCLTVSFVYHLYTSHGTNHCILVTMFGWTEFKEKCLVDLKFHRGRLWDEGEDSEHHFASGRKWWLIK